ncbi:unnamed protein product, partial [Menidia menidia]
GVWLTLLYTYLKIFIAAKAANSADGNIKKARNTILLHGFQLLLSMLTFLAPFLKTLVSLLPKHYIHVLFVWYIVIQVVPRFVSPIVYGLRDKTFKQYLRKYLCCTTKKGIHFGSNENLEVGVEEGEPDSTEIDQIHASLCCFILIFTVFTTLNTPLNLAVMAVECYIAVCFPLQHSRLCTVKRTYVLICCIWAVSAVSILTDVFIILATEPERLFYSIIFCERDNLFRHPASLQKRDVSYLIYLGGVWLTLLYTYFKIFVAAKAANSSDGKIKKARNTILLHGFQLLLSMLTFLAHLLKTALVSWFPKHYIQVLFVWYIIIQVVPRFVSPIVYGLRDKTFKQYLRKYLCCTTKKGIQ